MRHFRLLLLALAVSIAGAATAQPSGTLAGSVIDENGAPLPAATVTLSGTGGPLTQATNGSGQFRFQALAPGDYRLDTRVEGFTPLSQAIAIRAEQNAVTIRLRALRE